MAADPPAPGGGFPESPTPAVAEGTIAEAARAIRAGRATAESLVDTCLERIARRDPSINAFISIDAAEARAGARRADRELASGADRGPLHGIPISVKDIIDVRGIATTAASRVRTHALPAAADATALARLRQAGAIVIGKTNLHEFAFGTTNEDSAFGPVHHPLDPERSPGGSSGGSAASVMAGMAMASIGTDTGGSIRIPSAACGLVGLKPAYGEIPTDGVIPLSQTFDHVGPLCRSVEDAAIVYAALAGTDDASRLSRGLQGARIGVLRGTFTARLEPAVARAFEDACVRLADAGASIDEAVIPHAADIAPIYLHIVLADAAAFHAATLESRPHDYTPQVRIRLEMGRYVLAEDYVRALRGREVLTREVDEALAARDALMLPTLPIEAPRLGAATVAIGGAEEPVRNAMLRLTQIFNITGHPAISLPCGLGPQGLPIGLQLAGARHGTYALLGLARAVERLLGWDPGSGTRDPGPGTRDA